MNVSNLGYLEETKVAIRFSSHHTYPLCYKGFGKLFIKFPISAGEQTLYKMTK